MKAYAIGQLNINNQDQYTDYVKQTSPIVKKYKGKFLVRGGKFTKVWGENQYTRHVVIEFPDLETAFKWHNSDEYMPIRKIREENSSGNLIIVEGYKLS